jgi:hypothetical protein
MLTFALLSRVGFDQSTAGRRKWKDKHKAGQKSKTQSSSRKKGAAGPLYPDVKGEAEAEKATSKTKGSGRNGKGGGGNPIKW